ncbi:GMC oxidoreductase [Ilumatobacter nonamiensis]|uniref:GMC oxidoreductase n=1 Tax=Ilumatobacter nonamiensis TaxID=467093 RepID=UPI00034C64CC|nr:GMC oxidoreductase [Ilumatobacter nonamiensis]
MKWVVVGAGSAGCVAARRLVDAGHHVTLIEAGAPMQPDHGVVDIDGSDAFAAIGVEGRTFPDVVARRTTAGPERRYLRGRGVGGSSAVNGMVALRGDPALYASWGWAPAEVEQAWARCLIPEERPEDAELGRTDRLLLEARSDAEVCPLTRRNGRRVTSAEAYLWPILGAVGSRFEVVSDRVVDRVDFDASGAATGVTLAGGEQVDCDAVVLAAGAIHSPTILQRSGITAAGTGLRDHPAAGLLLKFGSDSRVQLDPARRGLATASIVNHDGIQLLALNHLGVDSPPEYAMLLVALMRPISPGGSVRLRSDDPMEPPIVDFHLLSHADDRRRLAVAVREALTTLDDPPFGPVVDEVFIDDRGTRAASLDSDEAIEAWLLEYGADYVHASSSCATVLDDAGGVIGHEGTYVCDASAFPGIPDANTHLPTTMLAERIAARWPGVAGAVEGLSS